MKTIVLIALLFSNLSSISQIEGGWRNVGSGIVGQSYPNVRSYYNDTINDRLYLLAGAGNQLDGKDFGGIAYWDGTEWFDLNGGITNGAYIASAQFYKDKLYVVGSFLEIDSVDAPGSAVWYDNQWHNTGWGYDMGSIFKLKVIDDELYALGGFDTIAGIYSPGIAKFDGENWSSVVDFTGINLFFILDIEYYKGDLYVAGNFSGKITDLLRWDGDSTSKVGSGIQTSSSSVADLQIFQDKLYVSGNLYKDGGDPGNGIAAWDGEEWEELSYGIYPGTVMEMAEFDGKLWIGGSIEGPPEINDSELLVAWDGANWHSMQWTCTFCSGVGAIEVFRDELYIGGYFYDLNGDDFGHLAKYDPTYTDMTIANEANISEALSVYPNPNNGQFTVRLSGAVSNANVQIINAMGQIVWSKQVSSVTEFEVNSLDLPNGLYLMNATGDNAIFQTNFVVSH